MAGSEPIKAISCSPLGTYIAALTESQSVLIWNVSDGKMAARLGVSFSAKDLSWSADELVLFTDLSPVCWWDGGTLRLFLLPDQLTYLEAFTSPQSASDGEDLLAMLAALAQSSHAPEMVRIFAGQLLPPSVA
jgi:WD40 repeat protein